VATTASNLKEKFVRIRYSETDPWFKSLNILEKEKGKSKSELIREAIEVYSRIAGKTWDDVQDDIVRAMKNTYLSALKTHGFEFIDITDIVTGWVRMQQNHIPPPKDLYFLIRDSATNKLSIIGLPVMNVRCIPTIRNPNGTAERHFDLVNFLGVKKEVQTMTMDTLRQKLLDKCFEVLKNDRAISFETDFASPVPPGEILREYSTRTGAQFKDFHGTHKEYVEQIAETLYGLLYQRPITAPDGFGFVPITEGTERKVLATVFLLGPNLQKLVTDKVNQAKSEDHRHRIMEELQHSVVEAIDGWSRIHIP